MIRTIYKVNKITRYTVVPTSFLQNLIHKISILAHSELVKHLSVTVLFFLLYTRKEYCKFSTEIINFSDLSLIHKTGILWLYDKLWLKALLWLTLVVGHSDIPGEASAHAPAYAGLGSVLLPVVGLHLQQLVLVGILNKHVGKLSWITQVVSWSKVKIY